MGPIPTILEFENVVASGNNYLWCLQATKVCLRIKIWVYNPWTVAM